MDKKEFDELIRRAGLSKKSFAEMLGIKPQTVHSWGTTKDIPYWVKPFLINYIKAKTLDSVKEVICEAPDPSPIGPAPAGQSDEVDDG